METRRDVDHLLIPIMIVFIMAVKHSWKVVFEQKTISFIATQTNTCIARFFNNNRSRTPRTCTPIVKVKVRLLLLIYYCIALCCHVVAALHAVSPLRGMLQQTAFEKLVFFLQNNFWQKLERRKILKTMSTSERVLVSWNC